MSLLAIKAHLMTVKMASLANLSHVFAQKPEVLRDMLAHWVKKGKVQCCQKKSACGSKCFQCPQAEIEIYEWIGE